MTTIYCDTKVVVYKLNERDFRIGAYSTSKDVSGWLWDDSAWARAADYPETCIMNKLSGVNIKYINSGYLQAGIGDDDDLYVESIDKVYTSGVDLWSPNIDHGTYFFRTDDFYFHSDGCISQPVPSGLNSEGTNEIQLLYEPKRGVPLKSKYYSRYDEEAVNVLRDIKHVYRFTGVVVSGEEQSTIDSGNNIVWANVDDSYDEFTLDRSTSPPTAIYNKNYIQAPWDNITVTGLDDIMMLEYKGTISESAENGAFFSSYYPLISGISNVDIYSIDGGSYTSWTPVDNLLTCASGDHSVEVDWKIGQFRTGNGTHGIRPDETSEFYIRYKYGPSLEYEADDTEDTRLINYLNMYPLVNGTDKGFIVMSPFIDDPYSVVLESKNTSGEYFLNVGNNYSVLMATVYDKSGSVLSDIQVTFEIISEPVIGLLGGSSDSITSYTNAEGKAYTYLTAPTTINSLTNFTSSVTTSGLYSNLVFSTEVYGDTDSVYLYALYSDDDLLSVDSVNDAIKQYLVDEGFYPTVSGISQEVIDREIARREFFGLPVPVAYRDEVRNARRMMVCTSDALAYDPITGLIGTNAPIMPTTISGTNVIYPYTLSGVSGSLRGYELISEGVTTVRAFAYSQLRGLVYSNEVDINILLPDYMKGVTILTDGMSDKQTLWEAFDYFGIYPANVPSGEVRIPLGFRIPSGIYRHASALDGAVFVNVNSGLSGGYFV